MGPPIKVGGGGGSDRRATGDAAVGTAVGDGFRPRRKRETVLRLLRGEDLE